MVSIQLMIVAYFISTQDFNKCCILIKVTRIIKQTLNIGGAILNACDLKWA